MFDSIIIGIALIGLLYSTYTDLKSKLVPDELVYGMIGLGIILRIIQAILFGIPAVTPTIITTFIYALAGFVLYYFRAWADGDFGMFIIIALFLPPVSAPWPPYLSYLFNLAVLGSVYGLVYTLYLALKPEHLKDWSKKFNNQSLIFSVFLGMMFAFITQSVKLGSVLGFILGFLIYPFILITKSLEKFMQRRIGVDELESGDWVLEDIIVKGKVIIPKNNPGLTKSQIEKLKKLSKKGLVKKILVKDGIPFIPAFFLAYLASYFYGDIVSQLVSVLITG